MILLRASGKVLEDTLVCSEENSHQVQVYFPKSQAESLSDWQRITLLTAM